MSEDKPAQLQSDHQKQNDPISDNRPEVKNKVTLRPSRPFLFVDTWNPNDVQDTGAKQVRRHAAKASAGKRAATMALKIKTQRAERLRHERQQRAAQQRIETSAQGGVQIGVRGFSGFAQSPVSSNVDQNLMDPFDAWEVNIKNDAFLRSLYAHTVHGLVFLVDLRLPMISDRTSGKRNAGKLELPHLILKSEPLFWAAMLGAASVFVNRTGSHAKDDPICVKYRYMALRGINKRIARVDESAQSDCGLVSAIATLGLWERQWGSKEVWRSHCKGLEMLQLQMRGAGEQEVLTSMAKACKIPDPQPVFHRLSARLTRLQQTLHLDQNLIAAVYHCRALEYMSDRTKQVEGLRVTAAQILAYSPMNAVSDTISSSNYRSEDPEGERRNLEMHTLTQGAGVAMIKYMAGDAVNAVGIEEVDFQAMCLESIELAEKVSQDPVYDELLLWATLTTYALTGFHDPDGLAIVRKVLSRLGVNSFVELRKLLQDIAYMHFPAASYNQLWVQANPVWGGNLVEKAPWPALPTRSPV